MICLLIGIFISLPSIYVNADLRESHGTFIRDEHFRVRRTVAKAVIEEGASLLAAGMKQVPKRTGVISRSASRSRLQSSGAGNSVRNTLKRVDPYTNKPVPQAVRDAMRNRDNVRDGEQLVRDIQKAGAVAFGGVIGAEVALTVNDAHNRNKPKLNKDIEDNHIKDNHDKDNHVGDNYPVDDDLD